MSSAGWPDPDAPRSAVDAFKREARQAAREAWAKKPTSFCPLCGIHLVQIKHQTDGGSRAALSCPEACEFLVVLKKFEACTACGHHHAGKDLGGICVGCPCEHIGGKDVVVHAEVQCKGGAGIESTWKLPSKAGAS